MVLSFSHLVGFEPTSFGTEIKHKVRYMIENHFLFYQNPIQGMKDIGKLILV